MGIGGDSFHGDRVGIASGSFGRRQPQDWFGGVDRPLNSHWQFSHDFLLVEFTRKQPFINLRLLGRRNFGLASIVNVSLGRSVPVYILPLYLAQIQDTIPTNW